MATSFTDIQPFVVLGGFSMYPLWVVKRGIPALAFIMLAAAFLPKARSKKTFKRGGGDFREVIHRERARRASTATSLRSLCPHFGKGTPPVFVTRSNVSFNLNPVVKGVKPAAKERNKK